MSEMRTRAYGEGLGDGANSVVGKLRLILESFAMDDDHLSLAELSRRTGISKASVYRLAQELLEWGMLERSGHDYRLGMRAFELGSRVPRFRVLRDVVRPFMEQIHHKTGETVHLGVLDGRDVLYLEKVSATSQSAKPSRIAGRMPVHCTATGKILLAHAAPSLFEEIVADGLPRVSAGTVVAPGILADQLRLARERGYAVEREETTVGYSSVAAPLFGSSRIVLGALSITAPTFRADIENSARVLTEVSRRIAATRRLN